MDSQDHPEVNEDKVVDTMLAHLASKAEAMAAGHIPTKKKSTRKKAKGKGKVATTSEATCKGKARTRGHRAGACIRERHALRGTHR